MSITTLEGGPKAGKADGQIRKGGRKGTTGALDRKPSVYDVPGSRCRIHFGMPGLCWEVKVSRYPDERDTEWKLCNPALATNVLLSSYTADFLVVGHSQRARWHPSTSLDR